MNHVFCMLPARDEDEFKYFPQADIAFIQRWLNFTDTHADLLRRTVPLPGLSTVASGKVDGTAAFLRPPSCGSGSQGRTQGPPRGSNDSGRTGGSGSSQPSAPPPPPTPASLGFVFLFNPGYAPQNVNFTVDDRLGQFHPCQYTAAAAATTTTTATHTSTAGNTTSGTNTATAQVAPSSDLHQASSCVHSNGTDDTRARFTTVWHVEEIYPTTRSLAVVPFGGTVAIQLAGSSAMVLQFSDQDQRQGMHQSEQQRIASHTAAAGQQAEVHEMQDARLLGIGGRAVINSHGELDIFDLRGEPGRVYHGLEVVISLGVPCPAGLTPRAAALVRSPWKHLWEQRSQQHQPEHGRPEMPTANPCLTSNETSLSEELEDQLMRAHRSNNLRARAGRHIRVPLNDIVFDGDHFPHAKQVELNCTTPASAPAGGNSTCTGSIRVPEAVAAQLTARTAAYVFFLRCRLYAATPRSIPVTLCSRAY